MRRASLLPPLLAAATILFVAFIALSVRANLSQIRTLHEAGRLVTHTLEVQRQLDSVLLDLTQAETGQRGYLLTGDESYLEPYDEGRRQLDAALEQLAGLVQDSPAQMDRVERLRALTRLKMGEVAATIEARRAGSSRAAAAIIDSATGRKAMEDIRGVVKEISGTEAELLKTRQDDADRTFNAAYAGRTAAGVFSAVLLVLLSIVAGLQATIRARAARAVKAEREHLRVTVGSIADAVIATDTGGRITLMNPVASALTGWAVADAMGRPAGDVFRIVTREGRTVLVARDGTERPVDDSSAPIKSEEGAVVGAVLVFRDVSERRRQEEALRESEQRYREAAVREQAARAEAEEAIRIKDEFLAVLSHELRTPLNAVLGWTQILQSSGLPEGTLHRGLAAIKRNADAQRRLVEDLLEVSRIVTRKFTLDCKPVDVRDLLSGSVEDVRPVAAAKDLAVLADLTATPAIVNADVDRLHQVVANLLSNAVKFTPPGGRIEFTSRVEGDTLVLTVRDTGQGIAPDVVPFIFDRFRQGDASSTRTHGGLGLGLAIAKHIVERHGGTIMANSEGIDRGSTFVVRLPLMAVEPERQEIAVARTPLPLTGIRALVVDDQPDSRELLFYALDRAGAVVVLADSGAEALTAAARQMPDVILADLQMPEMDGFELLRRLRAMANGHMPVTIALTARAREGDATQVSAAGFAAYLTKPVDLPQLSATIRRLVDARR